jgi:hypothetical protein
MAPRTLLIVGAAVASIAVASGYAATSGGLRLGAGFHLRRLAYKGYYDGHKDTYLVTDVSSKSQAKALRINYSPELKKFHGAPAQYFIKGKAARRQLAVFGSEPGESDYNPLWEEVYVTWKPGETPVLLVKDDQVKALAKAGKVTLRDAHIVLNAPITKVGK